MQKEEEEKMNKKQLNRFIFCLFLVVTICLVTSCNKNKHVHEWTDATCTNPKICTTCGETEGVALGHVLGNWITDVEATCTTAGLKHEECTRCHITLSRESIEPLNHDLVHYEALEPTCTESGHTAYDACTRCDYTTYVELPSRHNWGDPSTESEMICLVCGTINIPEVVNASIALPTEYMGEEITWVSSDHAAMLDDGTIVSSNVDRVVTLEASFLFHNEVLTKQYDVTVKAVSADLSKYSYAYDYYKSKLVGNLGKDAKLITKSYNGFTVKYESLDENIITSKGVITQTIYDQHTIMNIYVMKDGLAVLYPVEVTVLAYNSVQRVDFAKPIVDQLIEDFQIGVIDTLPVYIDEYEVDLKWSSNIPEMIVLGNMVLTPMEKTDVDLKCTIVHGTSKFIKEYALSQVGGTISKELYIQKLLEAFSRVELKGSINHLHDEYGTGELYLDYQERINSGGVLNLFNTNALDINRSKLINVNLASSEYKNAFFGSSSIGTNVKPSLSQTILDEKMYQGYQMPNDTNVLWIVVHETAMTIAGQDAELLANIQYRYAFQQDDARAASWNYQIDAYSIYQSFEDDVICWHAGDGTSYGTGNTNGIGIEMCVNRDGNYEGTIHNNAKLVASLMLKYNLNLDNVKRHYDMSGKECPSYLIRTSRWEEFVEMVRMEYLLQKYLKGATISYELTTSDMDSTDNVLAKYFDEGANGLWYNKAVQEEVDIDFKINVRLDGHTYEATSTIILLPNEVANE